MLKLNNRMIVETCNLFNFGMTKNANGMSKKMTDFFNPDNVASKSIVQIKDANISTYINIGKINAVLNKNFQFFWNNKVVKKTIIEILPNAKLRGSVIKITAKKYNGLNGALYRFLNIILMIA